MTRCTSPQSQDAKGTEEASNLPLSNRCLAFRKHDQPGDRNGVRISHPTPRQALSWAGSQGFSLRAEGAGAVGSGAQGPGLGGPDPRKAMDHPEG